ncbi:MAG: hypothetical protein AAF222_05490 [Pseudomonadota bacterium]
MQIVFHLGAHGTDDGLLIRSLLQNRARLAGEGVSVPGPMRYRELFSDISTRLRGDTADPETEALILEAIRSRADDERVILSNENFLCRPCMTVGSDGLYPKADKSAWLAACLPQHTAGFAIGIRNPASYLPEIARRLSEDEPLPDEILLDSLLWSDVIADIGTANPGAEILVWCHEDTPFIWSELMREVAGVDPYFELDGEFDMLETIITEDGMSQLEDFLASRSLTDQISRRRAVSAFLEDHAIEEKVVEDIEFPGWTNETVDMLTEIYDEDVAQIAALPQVTFVSP